MSGHTTEPIHRDVQFLAGARRELSPSIKKIIDNINYELTDEIIQIEADSSCYDRQETTLTFSETTFGFELDSEYEIPVEGFYPKGVGITQLPVSQSRVLNPFKYKIRNGDKRYGPIQDANAIYELLNVEETTFTTKKMFKKVLKNTMGDNKVEINNYEVGKVKYVDLLKASASVTITYRQKDSEKSSTSSFSIIYSLFS